MLPILQKYSFILFLFIIFIMHTPNVSNNDRSNPKNGTLVPIHNAEIITNIKVIKSIIKFLKLKLARFKNKKGVKMHKVVPISLAA